MTIRELRSEVRFFIKYDLNSAVSNFRHRFIRMPALRTRLWFNRNETTLLWLAIIALAIKGA